VLDESRLFVNLEDIPMLMSDALDTVFYKDLPANQCSISELMCEHAQFVSPPETWHVLITDIKNSTKAVGNGQHQVVNLIATGSVIAALNIAQKEQIEIAFFFGGDGATMLVPSILLEKCLNALHSHQGNVFQNFGLDLRVGHVSMREIYESDHEVKVAKFKMTPYLNIPIVLGDGLRYAEEQIKRLYEKPILNGKVHQTLDLSGMECRWDRIKPPVTHNEVVSLLVDAVDEIDQANAFAKVLDQIEKIYGPIKMRNPISSHRLKIKATLMNIGTEMRAKLGKFNFWYLIKNYVFTQIGKIYYGREQNSRTYLENLVLLSDTLVVDGRINTIISGTVDQRKRLVEALDQLEASNLIVFGWHVSPESVVSCYVRNRVDQHIHFVDGSEGGYTQAAKILKGKLALRT